MRDIVLEGWNGGVTRCDPQCKSSLFTSTHTGDGRPPYYTSYRVTTTVAQVNMTVWNTAPGKSRQALLWMKCGWGGKWGIGVKAKAP